MNLDVLESPDEVLRAVREDLRAGASKSQQSAHMHLPAEVVWWVGQPGSGLDALNVPLDARVETLAREWILHPEEVLAKRGEGYYKRAAEQRTTGTWQARLAEAKTDEERTKVEADRYRSEESVRDELRRAGIHALADFKSKENIQLLLPLLNDPVSLRSTRDGKTFTEIYLTRREAYAVLKEWGVDVKEPVTEMNPAK